MVGTRAKKTAKSTSNVIVNLIKTEENLNGNFFYDGNKRYWRTNSNLGYKNVEKNGLWN
jgi:hypothetical protein